MGVGRAGPTKRSKHLKIHAAGNMNDEHASDPGQTSQLQMLNGFNMFQSRAFARIFRTLEYATIVHHFDHLLPNRYGLSWNMLA